MKNIVEKKENNSLKMQNEEEFLEKNSIFFIYFFGETH